MISSWMSHSCLSASWIATQEVFVGGGPAVLVWFVFGWPIDKWPILFYGDALLAEYSMVGLLLYYLPPAKRSM